MADAAVRPIVIKRYKKVVGGHHGGAWKIAYADFVTAMMAFFLLMWLLGSTSKGDLQGVAEYFQTPLKVSLSGGNNSGSSTSVLQGGGKNITEHHDLSGPSRMAPGKRTGELKDAEAALERAEALRLEQLKRRIELAIEANPALKQFSKQLLLDITSEGLRIQIVDEKNRPMFDSAHIDLKPYTRNILREIGRALNEVPNKISLSGHTDATPYSNGEKGYGNWELSSERANASRRELIAGGLDDKKVVRVVGLSSAVLMDKADPLNPVNRRVSIIVMNKRAELSAASDGGTIALANRADAVGLAHQISPTAVK